MKPYGEAADDQRLNVLEDVDVRRYDQKDVHQLGAWAIQRARQARIDARAMRRLQRSRARREAKVIIVQALEDMHE